MKKTFAALAVLLAVVSGIMFTGCDRLQEIWDENKDEFLGPKGEWCEYDLTYDVGGQTVLIECYAIYNDKEYTNKNLKYKVKEGEEEVVKTTLPEGLTICMVPKAGSSDELLSAVFGQVTNGMYALKTFPKNATVESENEDGTGTKEVVINSTFWTIIYNAAFYDSTANLPSELKSGLGKNVEVDGTGAFNWKKILATLAIAKLSQIE
ncbi:MAG: hypothetical protein MJ162_03400 [Treponema sp.]|nr:hypothetical protein [Treponema sp.]